MLIFKTCFGDYLLQNSSRIDLFKTKEGKVWKTFIAIDANKHLLQCFESEAEASTFCQTIREKIRLLLKSYTKLEEKFLVEDLSKMVKDTMEIIITNNQNIWTHKLMGESI